VILMPFAQKVDRLLADLRGRGISQWTVAPPVFRLAWALGVELPPPFFLGFLPLALFSGASFAVTVGLIMCILQWQLSAVPLEIAVRMAVFNAAIAGVFFGLAMAAYFRWKARQLDLPRWDSYPEAAA
jgi:hypothetical protein